MPRISQLDPLTGLSKLDLFEVTQRANNKSCSITAQEMGNYFKTLQNGGFRGSTSKELDNFTVEDVGVWYWTGNDQTLDLQYGTVEIITNAAPDDDNADAVFIQRISSGSKVCQRGYNDRWSLWSELNNHNGCKIEYGQTNATSVSWPEGMFTDTPAVTCTPVAGNNDSAYNFHIIINSVTSRGFSVTKLKSDRNGVTETTTVVEDTGAGTKTTTTSTTQGAWIQDDGITFNYIAVCDAP